MQHYIYKSHALMYNESDLEDNKNQHFNDKINTIIELKDREIKKNIKLLSNIVNETKNKLQENFANIPDNELQANLDTLKLLESNIIDFENIDMNNIQKTMAVIKSQRLANKKKIIDILTNIYVLATIDNINKGNASAYKEYLKYQDPYKNNKYYRQYA